MKITKLFTILLLLAMVGIVSADNITLSTSTTVRENVSTVFPQEIFYVLLLIGIAMLLINIRFLSAESTPGTPMILVSIIGFALFLICAYLAPLAGSTNLVVSGSEAKYITAYTLSPEVTYICMGLAAIMFLLIWYGVIRLWQIFAANQKRLNNPDHQFEMYMRGED